MTAQEQTNNGPSSTSWALVVLFWAYVMIPLSWGVYKTLEGVVALFTG